MSTTLERPIEAPLYVTQHNEPAAVLDRAAERVLKGWCQDAAARNHSGSPVPFAAPDAAFFCLGGAVYREAGPGRAVPPMVAVAAELRARGWEGSTFGWNDTPGRKVAEVVDVLVSAADRC